MGGECKGAIVGMLWVAKMGSWDIVVHLAQQMLQPLVLNRYNIQTRQKDDGEEHCAVGHGAGFITGYWAVKAADTKVRS
jgi:hypothetical protein